MGWLHSSSNRREDNHGKWEKKNARDAIDKKFRARQIRLEDEAKEAKRRKEAEKEAAKHTKPRSPWDRSSNYKRPGGWSW